MVGTRAATVAARARAARARALQVADTVKHEPQPTRTFALWLLLALAALALIRLPGLRWVNTATKTENLMLNRPMLPHRWVMTKVRLAVDRARDNSEEAGLAGLIAAGSALALLDWKANRDGAGRSRS